MVKSILVCLDGSAFGEQALPAAIALARKAKANLRLVLVHLPLAAAFTEPTFGMDRDLDRPIKERCRSYVESAAERVHKAAPEIAVTSAVPEGPIVDMVLKEASDNKSDLVVLSTHGRGPLGRFWLGSVADELLRRLPVPMLLMRPHEASVDFSRAVAFRHVLVPLDGSALSEQVIAPAIEIGILTNVDYTLLRAVKSAVIPELNYLPAPALPEAAHLLAELKAMHADETKRAAVYLEGVAKPLRARSLPVQTAVVSAEQPALAVLDAAGARSIDLLAVATHGRHGIPRMLLGSVADKIIRGTTLPVLVYRPR